MLSHPNLDPRANRDVEDRLETVNRRSRRLTFVAAIFFVAVLAVGWFGYAVLSEHGGVLSQFTGLRQNVSTLGDRLKDTEGKLQSWAGDRQQLGDQMAKLGQQMQTKMDTVRKQALESSAEMVRRVEGRVDAKIDNRMQGVETRISGIEASNQSGQQHVVELQRELAQARREIAQQADELAAVRHRVDDAGVSQQQQLTSLKSSEDHNRREVSEIANKLAVRRIDFEVTKNHNRELAPGISVDFTGTDVTYRRVSGWMWIMPDRRTVWLKNQAAQQPVTFYGYKDGKKRELVITNVTRNSVSGYLLLPGEPAEVVASIHNGAQ